MSGDKSDEEYLESVRKARRASVAYFNSANKPERERWVVNEFLSNLGESFSESEVQSVGNEPPDVRFRQAAFEVKEIQDKGRRRHADYKAALKRANAAKSPKDLLEPANVRDVTYSDVCDRVEKEVAGYSEKYSPEVRAQLDLLFYVNLEDVYGYVPSPLPAPSTWEHYGFRSVSLVMGRLAGVLMATSDAPDFLKIRVPRMVLKPHEQEGRGEI